jgi:ribosome maturation factor RimP
VGVPPAFFYDGGEHQVKTIQTEIEARLEQTEPEVEVLLAEVVSGSTLRLFIDHPEGVTLALCERVSGCLSDYRDRYMLEVSSPGEDRPLTRPAHFRRFLGRRARVRLRDAIEGHRTVTGELVGASDRDVAIVAEAGLVTVPYEQIHRSNLVPGE